MDKNIIHEVDCIEGMQEMEKNSVDMIVTSPPYNIGVDYNEHDDTLSRDEYLEWMKNFGNECHRVLKPKGSLFFNIGDKPSDEFRSLEVAQKIGYSFELQNTIHWVKHIASPEENVNIGHYKPVNSYRYVNNCHEYIFHFSLEGDVGIDPLSIGVEYAHKSNVERWDGEDEDIRDRGNNWFIPYETVASKKDHPAAFPIKLPEMCIELHGLSDDKGVVLDPFMGIGSTAIAARKTNNDYIGFEIDSEYARKARKRLKNRQKKVSEYE